MHEHNIGEAVPNWSQRLANRKYDLTSSIQLHLIIDKYVSDMVTYGCSKGY